MLVRAGALAASDDAVYECESASLGSGSCGLPALAKVPLDRAVAEFLVDTVVDHDGQVLAWQDQQRQLIESAKAEIARLGQSEKEIRGRAGLGRYRLSVGEITDAEGVSLQEDLAQAREAIRQAARRLAELEAEPLPDDLRALIPSRLDGLHEALGVGLENPLGQVLAHRQIARTYSQFTVFMEENADQSGTRRPSGEPAAGHPGFADPFNPDQISWLLGGQAPPPPEPHTHHTPPETTALSNPPPGFVRLYLVPDLLEDLSGILTSTVLVDVPAPTDPPTTDR